MVSAFNMNRNSYLPRSVDKTRVWMLLWLQKKETPSYFFFIFELLACDEMEISKDHFTNIEDWFTWNLFVCRHELRVCDLKGVKPIIASAMALGKMVQYCWKVWLLRWSLHIWDRMDKSTTKNHPSTSNTNSNKLDLGGILRNNSLKWPSCPHL